MSAPADGVQGWDWYPRFGKRLLDLVVALPLALLVSPVALFITALIRKEDRGPAIFRQQRVGMGGRHFTLRKFRTMPLNTPDVPSGEAHTLKVTRTGRILRRTSLDEIPQLLSVLSGDMSLVGPRPAIPKQETLILLRSRNGSLELKPGLTGLAQVNSYDGMPEDVKAKWDGAYAANVTMGNDAKILLRTIAYLTRKPPQY